MSSDSHLETVKTFARFKGELPVDEDDYYWHHLILALRADHAFGDSETESLAGEVLANLGSEPDNDAIYELYARWRNELNSARAPFLFPVVAVDQTPIWNTCATSYTGSPPRSTLQP